MGRKPLTDTTSETAQAMDLVAQSAASREVAKQEINAMFLAPGETYNLHVCLEKARMYQDQMASGMLGLGAQLLLIKENEQHGNFMAAVEELGLSQSAANYAMAAARKFGVNSPTVGNLGNSKIRALTVLDDDSIRKLEDGDEVDGIGTIDDIAKMSIRELRAALRKEKQERKDERTALEEVVRQKESKISELEIEVAGKQPLTKEQVAAQRLDDMRKSLDGALSLAKDNLTSAAILIANAQEIDGVTVEQLDKWIGDTNWLTSLLDDTYQQLMQDMENIHPAKQED
ncbi:MAG: hypothetical protein IJ158_09205 [Treponema sp.]|nr:hypothetical protein [Treponema sp.]